MHAFVVPIRDDEGSRVPGVRIEDGGPKIGLNGVDNGRLWFDGGAGAARRLLDRYADVDRGRPLLHRRSRTPTARFFTMLGTLVQGRVCVGGGGDQRDARSRWPSRSSTPLQRRQFGNAGHGRRGAAARLRHAPAPAAARCSRDLRAALRAGAARRRSCTTCSPTSTTRERRARPPRAGVARRRHQGARHLARHPHASRSAARRAAAPATSSVNRFAALKADTDVFTTFEGDNTVLLQLVAKGLLTDYQRRVRDLDQLGMVAVRRRPGRRDRDRAHRRPRAARAAARRRARPATRTHGPARPRLPARRCSAGARSTCSPASPAGSSAASTTAATRSRCSARARTT